MSLRFIPQADAYVASVLAASAAQDRRYERDGSVIVGRIPPADAHLGCFASVDPERLAEISAKGGRAGRGR